jgi:hypothetical protein
MKLTKSKLEQIIKEEKDKLLSESHATDRAIGLYFDVATQNAAFDLRNGTLTKLFNNAVRDAIEDGYEDEEAVSVVAAGVRQLFGEWLSKTAI